MIKKLIKFLWSLRKQFVKYFVVGISGLVLDLATFGLFTDVFGIIPWIAVVINQAIVLAYNFTLNKYWSFKSDKKARTQMIRFLVLAGFNYLFSVATMYVFNEQIGFDKYLVRISTIAVMVSWNFFLYKYWVYKE